LQQTSELPAGEGDGVSVELAGQGGYGLDTGERL
jgi:hypothetical protein